RVEFRMPLHGEQIARTHVADRLDDAVRVGPRFDDEVAAEILDRLMMDGIGLDHRCTRIEPGQPRSRNERSRVTILRVDFPVTMVERPRYLRREVLPQRPDLRD